MKIDFVRLGWFRGAADPVALDAGGKSMVVYGQNGTGKSCFVDAIEYGIRNGRITHLAHEHSGHRQENAIPNTHKPEGENTELFIRFVDESELQVRIAPNGSFTVNGAHAIDIGAWDYRRTVLRQDEVADFIRARKGEKYSTLLPLFGLHELEVAAENLRQLAKSVEQEAKLAQKHWEMEQTDSKRQQAFGDDTDEVIESKIAEFHKTYCLASDRADGTTQCKELETELARRMNEQSAENQCYLALRALAQTDLGVSIQTVRDASSKLADSVEPLISEKTRTDPSIPAKSAASWA